MKKIFIILFCFIGILTYAQDTYYVKPSGGSNSNTGLSIAQAWATWEYAFTATAVGPGDTVYFMGGNYYPYETWGGYGMDCTRDGTAGNYINYFAYPGEVPVLNCENVLNDGYVHNTPIRMTSINYIHFKGLVVKNVFQGVAADECTAWEITGNNVIVENCIAHNVHGHGFDAISADELYYINCDAYDCANILSAAPGQAGTGFSTRDWGSATRNVYYIHCRAWKISDNGFSVNSLSTTTYDGCWSFDNGWDILPQGGHGFKLGYSSQGATTSPIIAQNCIAAFNQTDGFTSNDGGKVCRPLHVYNNIAYRNGYKDSNQLPYGFVIYNTTSSDAIELTRIYRNNISYANESGSIYKPTTALYTNDHNSWDIPLSLNSLDFQSIDSAGISGARGADGSLPVLTFLHPAVGGDQIDAGVDVGLTLDGADNVWGDPPSIGSYERPEVEPTLVTSIDVWGTGGATTITVEAGTLQMLKKTLPVDATDTTVIWSVTDGTGHGIINSSGLLTAGANGTVTVVATAHDESGIYGEEGIVISNQSPDAAIPSVTTKTIENITITSALTGGVINDDGGAAVTDRGVCWSLSSNPTTADSHNHEGTGIGDFDSQITGLVENTVYHVRAFAINIQGTAYGDDVIFSTTNDKLIFEGVTIVIGRDGTIIIKR